MNLSTNSIETLNNNSDFSLELSFFSLLEKEVEGILKAKTENETADIFISVEFTANKSLDITSEISSTKTCAEKNGTLFNTKIEKCGTEYENVKDGWCCYGTISQIEKSSSGKTIGIIIILLIAIGLIWFYLTKYRKIKRPVNLLKIARGRK
jgi:hypothetical protein